MNMTQARYPAAQMRASDADRDAVVATLSESYQAGRLTTEELEERTGRALAARTLGELTSLTADLPGPRPAAPGPRVPAGGLPPAVRVHRGALVILAVLAAALLVSGAFGVAAHGHHGTDLWWLLPVALIAARLSRRSGRGGRPPRRSGRFEDRFEDRS